MGVQFTPDLGRLGLQGVFYSIAWKPSGGSSWCANHPGSCMIKPRTAGVYCLLVTYKTYHC